ncbi:MAG TPA: DUF4331 family protein [Actinomycetes bacterium]
MSDHFSGPRAIAGPAGDICDVYAFPSPERPGHLVLVMTVLPRAGPSACFSDAILCRFRLRPVTVAAGAAAFTLGAEELVLDCRFDSPRPADGGAAPVQQGRCIPPAGEPVAFWVHDEQGACGDGLRVFAGLRSDPFFLDLPALQRTVRGGRLAFKEVGSNSLAGFNVLGIVVEADCAPLLEAGGGPLFAVVAETVAAGKLPVRLERVGRPEVKNVILSWKQFDPVNRDLELRDLYGLEDAFHLGKDYLGAYRARLNANLAAFDRLDGQTDWPLDGQGAHPLTGLLLADHLVVDLSKPYADDSFLEIEQAMLQGRQHVTCGGRSPNDDVMDTLYTLLVNAGRGPRVGDGVDRATAPATGAFPYLAPPNPPPPAADDRGTP